jgi:hypothetical protein
MIGKRVIFKVVKRSDFGQVCESLFEGEILSKEDDIRERKGVVSNIPYYQVVTDDGIVHQVKPFNIVSIVKV